MPMLYESTVLFSRFVKHEQEKEGREGKRKIRPPASHRLALPRPASIRRADRREESRAVESHRLPAKRPTADGTAATHGANADARPPHPALYTDGNGQSSPRSPRGRA